MITEFLLQLAMWLGVFVLGLMPDNAELVTNASGVISDIAGTAHGISAWFPWHVAGLCLVATYTGWSLLFIVKITRQLLAHVPQFGGSG